MRGLDGRRDLRGSVDGADYTLRVPTIAAIEVESEVGTVEVSGLTDNVTVQAGAGDVTVRDVAGGVNVEAPQSDISVGVSTDTRGERWRSPRET